MWTDQQTILKGWHHNRVDGPERVANAGTETLRARLGEIDERMCAPVEEIGEEARKATPMFVPRDPRMQRDELTKSIICPYRSWCEYCVRGRGKESPHLSREEQADESIPVVQLDYTRSCTTLETRMQKSRSSR